eukprot:1138184-Pelagomonas_calceolata.AAC.2
MWAYALVACNASYTLEQKLFQSDEVVVCGCTLNAKNEHIWSGRVHLNNQSPAWLQDIAKDIPEASAEWLVKNMRVDPIWGCIRSARHTIMTKIGECENLPLNKKQVAKVPHKPLVAINIIAPFPCLSNPNLQLKVIDWKSWAYTCACTDGSCQVQDGKTVIGAGVYHPMSD